MIPGAQRGLAREFLRLYLIGEDMWIVEIALAVANHPQHAVAGISEDDDARRVVVPVRNCPLVWHHARSLLH
jgi:hypothetical protein